MQPQLRAAYLAARCTCAMDSNSVSSSGGSVASGCRSTAQAVDSYPSMTAASAHMLSWCRRHSPRRRHPCSVQAAPAPRHQQPTGSRSRVVSVAAVSSSPGCRAAAAHWPMMLRPAQVGVMERSLHSFPVTVDIMPCCSPRPACCHHCTLKSFRGWAAPSGSAAHVCWVLMSVILLPVLLTNLMRAVQQSGWVSTTQVCAAAGADLVCGACSAGRAVQRRGSSRSN
jgi:hypothetical protein